MQSNTFQYRAPSSAKSQTAVSIACVERDQVHAKPTRVVQKPPMKQPSNNSQSASLKLENAKAKRLMYLIFGPDSDDDDDTFPAKNFGCVARDPVDEKPTRLVQKPAILKQSADDLSLASSKVEEDEAKQLMYLIFGPDSDDDLDDDRHLCDGFPVKNLTNPLSEDLPVDNDDSEDQNYLGLRSKPDKSKTRSVNIEMNCKKRPSDSSLSNSLSKKPRISGKQKHMLRKTPMNIERMALMTFFFLRS